MSPKAKQAGKLAAALALALFLCLPSVSLAKGPVVGLAGPNEPVTCKAGGTCQVKLTVTVRESFHINSAKPADPDLLASRLSIKAPKWIRLAGAEYPNPHEVNLSALGGKALVHDGRFTITAKLAVAKGAVPGPRQVEASLFYQACDTQMCFMPATAKAVFKIKVK